MQIVPLVPAIRQAIGNCSILICFLSVKKRMTNVISDQSSALPDWYAITLVNEVMDPCALVDSEYVRSSALADGMVIATGSLPVGSST